jgi:pimeloyl-ACP methyl ester carboxylesterase
MPKHELVTHRNKRADAAIVLIHGFGGDATLTWGKFPELLAADPSLHGWDVYSIGYSTSLSLDVSGIWAADPEIITLGGLLNTAADVPPLDHYRSLAFFAHSMGGLMLQKALVTTPALVKRTEAVLLFGTPSAGLAKARGIGSWLKRQAHDMVKGGPFITGLRSAWNETFAQRVPFKFLAIAGDRDEFVPRASSIDPFPKDVQRVVYGHHLQIVKPEDANHLGFKTAVKALQPGADRDWMDSALVAVESRDFEMAIKELEPRHKELDDDGLVMLALALESKQQSEKAIEILTQRDRLSTDPLGVLAGRLKRRWLVERRRLDAERSLDLYRQGLDLAAAAKDHGQAFYHAINVAFMERAFMKHEAEAKKLAGVALEHCGQAAQDKWRSATEGEAHLQLGNSELAVEGYRGAVRDQPKPWQAVSMYQQAVRVTELTGNRAAALMLRDVFTGALASVPVEPAAFK